MIVSVVPIDMCVLGKVDFVSVGGDYVLMFRYGSGLGSVELDIYGSCDDESDVATMLSFLRMLIVSLRPGMC